MSVHTIRFGIPYDDSGADTEPLPLEVVRRGRHGGVPCGHTHRSRDAAKRCAKSLAQGWTSDDTSDTSVWVRTKAVTP